MPRDARAPYAWLAVGCGLVAALIWASLGVRAVVMDNVPSTRALVVCGALVVVGLAPSEVVMRGVEVQRRYAVRDLDAIEAESSG